MAAWTTCLAPLLYELINPWLYHVLAGPYAPDGAFEAKLALIRRVASLLCAVVAQILQNYLGSIFSPSPTRKGSLARFGIRPYLVCKDTGGEGGIEICTIRSNVMESSQGFLSSGMFNNNEGAGDCPQGCPFSYAEL